jgi:hypothetical protein
MRRLTLALAAPLLFGSLATPAAAADAPSRKTPVSATNGAMCPADRQTPIARAEQIARIQAKLREQAAAEGSDVVVLNGRGYRYGDPPGVARDLQQLEIEFLRARAAARAKEHPVD